MTINNTFFAEIELTDTFGGDANYSWVKRARLEFKESTSDLAVVRALKAELGLNGVRARKVYGYNSDYMRYNIVGACACFFITWEF